MEIFVTDFIDERVRTIQRCDANHFNLISQSQNFSIAIKQVTHERRRIWFRMR